MSTTEPKVKKPKGPIRFEAIIPITIIWVVSLIYFTYFFDHHLKKAIEWAATQANGAEVNVNVVKTSFIKGEFLMEKIEVTNSEMPKFNLVEVGRVHFKYLWDALLRMKFVVEDASIDVIQMGTKRAHEGFVVPPPPPSES